MAEIIKTDALILSAIRWRESSKIVHIYTRELGALKVVAKGALRPKSSFRGVLETLNHCEVIFTHKAQRGLQTLNSAALSDPFFDIRDDLEKTAIAYSMLELLQKLFGEHEPVPLFFDYTVDLLKALSSSQGEKTDPFLWHFLFEVCEVLGFGWQLAIPREQRESTLRLDMQQGLVRPANSKRGLAITLTSFETLEAFVQSTPQQLEPHLSKLQHFPSEFSKHLLRYLSHHSETALDLNSLKWYVQ